MCPLNIQPNSLGAAPNPLHSSQVEAGTSEEIRNRGGHPETTPWGSPLSGSKHLTPASLQYADPYYQEVVFHSPSLSWSWIGDEPCGQVSMG